MLNIVSAVVKTLRLALPKVGVGWMFALLTIDFNRIAIFELGVAAILVTAMLSMHYFLSPFQVIFGRLADRFPIVGYRRTPYVIIGSVVSSFLFLALPSVAEAIGAGVPQATLIGFALFALFGISMAMVGDSYHALIAEVTTERSRSTVISVVWIVTILSTILAAVVMNAVRPEYTPEAMQRLYNLTPFIVIGSTLIGIIGMERRLVGSELEAAIARSKSLAPQGNPLAAAFSLLSTNSQTRSFFMFIFVAIFAIFLQDAILEVFGAEVFGFTVAETTRFQPTWGAGVLLGMFFMGALNIVVSLPKRAVAILGCVGTAVGMSALAAASMLEQGAWVTTCLFAMGIFTGFFNVGALALMMDMTIEGSTGIFMGLWGVAQAFGTGIATVSSGALHTALIESGLMVPRLAYGFIFTVEAVGLIVAAAFLAKVSVERFKSYHDETLSQADLTRAMAAGSAA